MERDRTLVVGGGLLGMATTFALAQAGEEVVLLERHDDLARGASHANGAMLTPSMPWPWNAPGVWRELCRSFVDSRSPLLVRPSAILSLLPWGAMFLRHSASGKHLASTRANFSLARYSAELTQRWCARLELRCDFAADGTLQVFRERSDFHRGAAAAELLRPLGLQAELLDPSATVAIEASLAPVEHRIAGAIRFQDDLVGDAREFVVQLRDRAEAFGAVIRTGVDVNGPIVEGARVAGVRTSGGPIRSRRVVVATGAATSRFLRAVGLRLPVVPVKGYSVTFDRRDGFGPSLPVIDDAMHAAIVPIGHRLRIAGTAEFAGFDTHVAARRIANLLRLCENLFPGLPKKLAAGGQFNWAGLRPGSADGRPFIGATSIPGLFVNAGHGHLGWTMAAGSGQLLADIVLKRQPEIPVESFGLDRS